MGPTGETTAIVEAADVSQYVASIIESNITAVERLSIVPRR